MGIHKYTHLPCGFCFVEYYFHRDAMSARDYLNGTKLDDRIIRVDLDPGFEPGRQFGRGATGGQVRDDRRHDYDEGRGGLPPRHKQRIEKHAIAQGQLVGPTNGPINNDNHHHLRHRYEQNMTVNDGKDPKETTKDNKDIKDKDKDKDVKEDNDNKDNKEAESSANNDKTDNKESKEDDKKTEIQSTNDNDTTTTNNGNNEKTKMELDSNTNNDTNNDTNHTQTQNGDHNKDKDTNNGTIKENENEDEDEDMNQNNKDITDTPPNNPPSSEKPNPTLNPTPNPPNTTTDDIQEPPLKKQKVDT
eukprot:CAMPEP_0201572064 /NCGR_PEP_ID=MMETSP0190_2-20130828/15130_1 /ASSEMBLY_ACC=CAM_ASM_000263 /TAXON_ID=37353 /ORGANISM="Rosalina sp." /LENGTH=302 /DNA_ID=CAMNT_0047997375 /DNA_START=224 /DNA_END=1135 /DNA_ORIENTATION=+